MFRKTQLFVHRQQPCALVALLSLDRDSLYSTERKPGACFVIASHLGSSDVQSWTQSAPLPPQIKANERPHFTTDSYSRCRYMTSFCRRTEASTTLEVFWQGCPFGISIFSPWLSFGDISIETPPSAKILSGQLSEEVALMASAVKFTTPSGKALKTLSCVVLDSTFVASICGNH